MERGLCLESEHGRATGMHPGCASRFKWKTHLSAFRSLWKAHKHILNFTSFKILLVGIHLSYKVYSYVNEQSVRLICSQQTYSNFQGLFFS